MLSDKERIRYSRQMLLPQIAEAGQLTLKQSKIAIIGLGGLGSPAAFYLAAMGIGTLVLVDDDTVELSNLQRQILYKISHQGQAKANAASKTLAALNNSIALEVVAQRATETLLHTILKECDLVLDCSDNFATRYLINRLAKLYSLPLVSGAAMAFNGQVCVVDNRNANAPCYECLFSKTQQDQALNCDTIGVVSPLLGVIGSMQAMAALNLLLGFPIQHNFLQYNALTMTSSGFSFSQSCECSLCNKV